MDIALFTTGQTTIIGVKHLDGTIQHKKIDTRIIFQDPELVSERLIATLKNKFGVDATSGVSRMCFGITGIINRDQAQIIKSYNLDHVTYARTFTGFSFKKCFGQIVDEKNIWAINDAYAIGLGLRAYKQAHSTVVFEIDKGIGISVIDKNGAIHETESGSVFIPSLMKTPHFLISGDSIETLLASKEKNIFEVYTKRLIETGVFFLKGNNKVINKISKALSSIVMSIQSKSSLSEVDKLMPIISDAETVFVWTMYEDPISKAMIEDYKLNEFFLFPTDENEKYLIPLIGCFEYPKMIEQSDRKITQIEYYSGGRKIYTFSDFDTFQEHWKQNHRLAHPDNEYRLFVSDGSILSRKISHIIQESDLNEFKF